MKKCPYCGTEHDDQVKVCPQCRAEVPAEPKQKKSAKETDKE